MNKINDWGFDFFIHLIIIILLWISPVFFSWKIIILGIIVYYLQLIILGDCMLTKKQFRTKKRSITFYWYYGRKIFPKLDMIKVKFYADWIFPYIILALAIIIQVVLEYKPLIL